MKKLVIVFILFTGQGLMAQLGIGTNAPHSSAMLDVQSGNKGVLLPRITTAQRKAIVDPAPGLMVFDTDKRTIMIFEGTRWGQLVFKESDQAAPVSRIIADGQADDFLEAQYH